MYIYIYIFLESNIIFVRKVLIGNCMHVEIIVIIYFNTLAFILLYIPFNLLIKYVKKRYVTKNNLLVDI